VANPLTPAEIAALRAADLAKLIAMMKASPHKMPRDWLDSPPHGAVDHG
jgi:hypothetical protein